MARPGPGGSGVGPPRWSPEPLTLVADRHQLHRAVGTVAEAIGADHPDGVTLVAVLKGAVVLVADLARRLPVPVRVEFTALAPFDGRRGRTRVIRDVEGGVTGSDVVLVTGTFDTGLTADFLRRHLDRSAPRSIRVATLVDRGGTGLLPAAPDYRVLTVPDQFVVGYGLDHHGRYRNLRDLWAVDPGAPGAARKPDGRLDP
jgi:hypoxanthine phosphoribosyltransferase